MEKMSKKDLIELISNQQSELVRYKARFKDLVAAHKGLLKDKESIESSLKSLTESNPSQIDTSCKAEESPNQLKRQLSTLTNSLATLSEEKSRMEASFQADKKQLRIEKLQADNSLKDLEMKLEHETRSHLGEMENLKAKIILERHQREKEQNDHGVMIRELQKLLSEERSKREKAELALENLASELTNTNKIMQASKKEASEAKSQLELLKEQLKSSKVSSGATTEKLQHELDQLKLKQLQISTEEQEKMKEAEERSKRQAAAHEERVANLEASLSELSQTIGMYDRSRQNDQIAIEKLKERIVQLEIEYNEEKSDLNASDLTKHIKKFRNFIEVVNKTAEKEIDVKKIVWEVLGDNELKENIHKQCIEDYELLQNDFEFYKQQFIISQKSNSPCFKVETLAKDQELKSQIKELKDKVLFLHSQLDKSQKQHKRENEEYLQTLQAEKSHHQFRVQSMESEWRETVKSLETQLSKQRERALLLVNEKEQDISDLKESLNTLIPQHLSVSKVNVEGEGVVLHFSEELARRDVELSRLRKDKSSIESELREARREILQLSSHKNDLMSLLHKQLQRFELCQSREGANLEYLKNVVINFLLTNNADSKCHMLNAIAAVLKFTEEEKTKIKVHSWWYKPQL